MKRRGPEEIVTLLREADSRQESLIDFCHRKCQRRDNKSADIKANRMWRFG